MGFRKTPRSQQCCANTKTGDRCDKYCAPGERLCSNHRPGAAPAGVIAQQDTDDVRVLLKRLTKDRDTSVRLRAIEAILKWEERRAQRCPICAANVEQDADRARIVEYATDAQRDALLSLIAQVNVVKAEIRAHIAAGAKPNTAEARYEPPPRAVASTTAPEVATKPEDAPEETVTFFREGVLVTEPRRLRNWRPVEDLS